MPVTPPMMKFHRKRYTKYIGNRVQMLPFHSVPITHRKMIPVGIEMSSVVSMNGPARFGAQPVVNMWWAQTMIDSAAMATKAATATL